MVNQVSLIRSDPVYRRLAEVESAPLASGAEEDLAINPQCFWWIDRQEKRLQMRRSATRCVAAAWALMTLVAITSSIVAFVFLENVTELFSLDENYFNEGAISQSSRQVPLLLAIVGVVFLVIGGAALLVRRFPGLRSTQASIDWATSCDAIAQLLSTGCSYSESFRAASVLMPKSFLGSIVDSDSAAAWLGLAVKRVDAGREVFEAGNAKSGDELKLRLLVQADSAGASNQDADPSRRWQAASDYFMLVADQRLGMLTHGLPPIATILSGIMLWVSISATLGWMWRSVAGLLRDLGGGL